MLKKETEIQQQHSMKKIIFAIFSLLVTTVKAQTTTPDSTSLGKITVIKDSRFDELVRKEAAFNEALAAASKSSKGYRLMILNTNDRPMAMKVRSQLLQNFPEQKVYMGFQPPFIKLKFGNFLTKEDAEAYKKDILKLKIITGNIYLLPETIETKPDKNKEAIEN